ncbi:MAG: hypothetical protein JWM80_1863 [Cyanobacteria bacterium RYN_339]|nr:hypothetical protein [Cyanobacteria bacterium RYN_339]
MYFYKLGYWTYDGAAGVELAHQEKIETEAFQKLVYACTAELIRRERKNKSHFPFAWIYDEVANLLVLRHGFRRVEYAAEYEVYGSGSVLDPDEDLPDLDHLYRFLKSEGLAP